MNAELQAIRKAFRKHSAPYDYDISFFNDKRANGRRLAVKSVGWKDIDKVWEKVIRHLRAKGYKGWKLYRNDDMFYTHGITKHITKPQTTLSVR
jgi:sugar phosphate isomerase/epimerase